MEGPVRQKYDQQNRVRERRVVGRFYGMKYIERAIKTETSTRTE